MSNSLKIETNGFVFTFVLSGQSLSVGGKHEDECLEWGTVIDDVLTDPETMTISGDSTTKFIANLEVDAIFDIFEQYNNNVLDKNIKITFPTTYKNDREHLCIAIDFKRSYGKQQNESKFIILDPINVPKDHIHNQKFNNFKVKTFDKFEKIQSIIDDNDKIYKERLDGNDKMLEVINSKITEMNGYITDAENDISTCETNLGSTNTNVAVLRTDITKLQQDLATLTTANNNLNAKVVSLETLISGINISIAELKKATTPVTQ